jgi:hypothetical protein
MKTRCYNQNFYLYSFYGGKGVRVCKEWEHSFENFYEWAMDNGYLDSLTLDRIDNNGWYSPGNCRWASRQEQTRNTSRNILITYKGKTQCLTDWANEYGMPKETIRRRLIKGKPLDCVFDKGDWRRNNGRHRKELL